MTDKTILTPEQVRAMCASAGVDPEWIRPAPCWRLYGDVEE